MMLLKTFLLVLLNYVDGTNIAIVTCATSKHSSRNNQLEQSALSKLLIPSLKKTIEKKYNYRVHIGIDDDDVLWNNPQSQQKIARHGSGLNVTFHTFISSDTIPFSKTAAAALKYNPDYIVRVNDDTEFLTQEWTSLGITALQNFNPPNVGVVAPTCNEGNTDIFTHDMVHKTHLKIFNEYYPSVFKNWYLDDWITKVYGSKRSKKLLGWRVKHHVNHHGTRYKVIYTEKHLNQLLKLGAISIDRYINFRNNKTKFVDI